MAIDLQVIGRHTLLFDDDPTLEFVNSKEALIEWNSLFIDRYDVRHLIETPPPSFRHLPASFSNYGSSGLLPDDDSYLFPDLDIERFMDLDHDHDHDGGDTDGDGDFRGADVAPTDGGYNCVPFSYGNSTDSGDQTNSEMDLNASTFHPSFPVPENILQNLPPTEKVHQIIARTAMFVGEHGGQSEIVLRVKQGDNPTFGFLMPHHHLHPYFRYLVDHPEVLKTDNNSKSKVDKTNGIQASGALSLLGSVYDSGEDEDVATEVDRQSERLVSGDASSASDTQNSDQSEQIKKNEPVSVHSGLPKVKASALNKYNINSIKPGRASSIKSDGNITSSIGSSMEKPKASSLFPLPEVKTSLVDPPSEMKRLVDRTVEIILKNGKDFETVLVEQDKDRGKFPFLLPLNQYNPYYLRALKKAQETRISGKTFLPGKDSSSWQEIDKNTAHQLKENDDSSLDGSDDLDVDSDKKEKFKMVIPKPKKDSQDHPSKESQQQQRGYTIDATAAILQAATRGIKNPNLSIFSKTSHVSTAEGEQILAPLKETDKSSGKDEIAKLAARVTGLTASEADSSEAGLMKQQKLKAERLRRAKMFAAMLKSGVAPLGSEPLRASSVEPPVSGNSGPAAENVVEEVKGITSAQNLSNDENEQKLSKLRHYRSKKHDEHGQEEQGNDENEEDSEEEVEDKKRSLKRHKSRHSSRHRRDRSADRHKRRRRHSSSKRKESRYRHKHDSSSMDDENADKSSDEERKHRRKRSSSKSKESRHRHKHDSSSVEDDDDRHHWEKSENTSEDERKHRKRRRKHDSSSDEDSKHHSRRHKRSHRKDGHREKSRKNDKSHIDEVELEEGEILTRSSDQSLSAVIGDDASREVSVDASKSPHQETRSSVPPAEVTEVPDELRAKIRAMLLANR